MHGDRETPPARRRPCRRARHAERGPGERDGAGAGRTTTVRRGPGRTRPRRPRAGRAASAPARSRERARRRRSPRLRECRRRGRTRPSNSSADNSPRALRSRRRARTRCPGRACPRAQANPLVVERYSLSPRATVASWYAMSSPSCRAPRSSAMVSAQAPAASSPASAGFLWRDETSGFSRPAERQVEPESRRHGAKEVRGFGQCLTSTLAPSSVCR